MHCIISQKRKGLNNTAAEAETFASFVYYMSAVKKTQEGVRQEATKQMALS